MRTFIQPGDQMNYTSSGAKAAGAVVLLGAGLVGILINSLADGETGPAMMTGVHSLTKVGSQAWVVGDPIYWDAGNSRFTKTAATGADDPAGVAFEAVGSGAGETTGKVLLLPGFKAQAAVQADFAGADLAAVKVELNAFLAKLRSAGIVAIA